MRYKYMIHTCNKRRWYVNEYLIPSMLEQGISKNEIIVAVDSNQQGVLMSTMQMFDWIGRMQNWDDVMWHLQDDVLISSQFKQKTDELYGDIICGFCSVYDESKRFGLVRKNEMWYSFPCIGIKNYYAKECAKWFFERAVYDPQYYDMIKRKKYVDTFFRNFVLEYDKELRIFNSKPNLVEHIDWLIGGSLINEARQEKQIRAYYWDENNLLYNIEKKLNNRTNV